MRGGRFSRRDRHNGWAPILPLGWHTRAARHALAGVGGLRASRQDRAPCDSVLGAVGLVAGAAAPSLDGGGARAGGCVRADSRRTDVLAARLRRRRSWHHQAVDHQTIFEAASMSKPVFAYAALQLHERRTLDLDTPLVQYGRHSAFAGDPRLDLVTARHVLSHISGLPNWRTSGVPLTLQFEPATRWHYSGEGYWLHLAASTLDEMVRPVVAVSETPFRRQQRFPFVRGRLPRPPLRLRGPDQRRRRVAALVQPVDAFDDHQVDRLSDRADRFALRC